MSNASVFFPALVATGSKSKPWQSTNRDLSPRHRLIFHELFPELSHAMQHRAFVAIIVLPAKENSRMRGQVTLPRTIRAPLPYRRPGRQKGFGEWLVVRRTLWQLSNVFATIEGRVHIFRIRADPALHASPLFSKWCVLSLQLKFQLPLPLDLSSALRHLLQLVFSHVVSDCLQSGGVYNTKDINQWWANTCFLQFKYPTYKTSKLRRDTLPAQS